MYFEKPQNNLLNKLDISISVTVLTDADSDACSTVTSSEVPDFHSLCESFIAAAALRPCVFVLDGVDELGGCLGLSPQQVRVMSVLNY